MNTTEYKTAIGNCANYLTLMIANIHPKNPDKVVYIRESGLHILAREHADGGRDNIYVASTLKELALYCKGLHKGAEFGLTRNVSWL